MSQKEVQNAIEQSEEVIDEAGEFISGCHEYQTRYALVDPILTSLGWDISDVNQVEVEYDTDWEFISGCHEYQTSRLRAAEKPRWRTRNCSRS